MLILGSDHKERIVISRVGTCEGIVKSEMVLLASHEYQQPSRRRPM